MSEEERKSYQEVVDGSRLIQGGVRTDDPETRAAGWRRIRKVRSPSQTKKIYDALVKDQLNESKKESSK